ncbi:MAG TPA: protein kinase [Planctomycetota bacterium]|nr:protein kinase [Planctomycetota bacterium]
MALEGKTLGIYRLGGELGRGGMGTVYRAETTAEGPAGDAGTTVALKVFRKELVEDERAFARCKLEAEIGKEIRHGNLVRTYGIGSADVDGSPCHFMVMELIEGKTLKGLLAELGPLPEPLLLEIADQVLAALDAIHQRGVVHRDIKPENIVITPDQRVLLMDLGVARRESGQERTRVGEFVGSLAYAPPEQFSGKDVGRRSDLYALGVTLYELATGKSPFPQKDIGSLVGAKLEAEIPPPRSVHEGLDPFWDQVIATCVRRDKAERFASAAALRAVLRDGEKSEWWRLREAPPVERVLKRLRGERRTPVLGRDAEALLLRDTYERAREQGAVLLLRGPSGAGKSRLLYDFLEEVAGAGGPAIAAGQGVGAGGVAYGPFVEAFGDLLGGGTGDPREKLKELLADTPGVVEPLAEFLRGGLQPGPESALSKDALFSAAVKLLRALAAERPLVLVLEDLHLAGAETVELFAHVARWAPGAPLFLVAVFADDEIPEGSPLLDLSAKAARLQTATTLALGNLPAAATEELVRHVVRHERTVRALAPALRARSEGNPLVVLEAIAHLEQRGTLAEKDDGLELTGPPDEAALPATVRDLAALKLAALDDLQRETLEVASILGAEFDAAVLAEVLGTKLIELLQRLTGLERQHRLVQPAGRNAFRFARRQLFEAIYDGVPEALRAEYHSLVADTLLGSGEAPEGDRAYALLRHLFQAERAPEAEPFLENALDYMARSFHASYAAPFLEKLAEALAPAAPPKRLAIAMRLWSCYDLLASRKDQMRVLDAARTLADAAGDLAARARVHALRAGTYWYFGDNARAEEEARTGLALAKEAGDRKWHATCTHTLGVVEFRHGRLADAAALWRQALEARRAIGDRRGEASTLQALSLVMPAIGEGDRVLGIMQDSLAIWREIGERRGEAVMLMNVGNNLVDAGRWEEGLAHLEQAIEAHRETGALVSEATTLANLGRAQEIVGWVDEARASWARALQLFTELGDPNGELAVRVMIGSVLGSYGEGDEAAAHLEAAVALAERAGAKAKLAMAHRYLGDLLHLRGERAAAWAHFRKALSLEEEAKIASGRVQTLLAAGNAALAEGDAEGAAAHLGAAVPDARGAGGSQLVLVLARLARAYRGTGQTDEALSCARETLERLEASGRATLPKEGPEIWFTLSLVHEDTGRRAEFLGRAKALVEERAARIRNDGYREHYLTRVWPNTVILAQAP